MDVDKFKLTGNTLLSVNKEVDEEEEALYAELYKELEETDRRVSRTRSSHARTSKKKGGEVGASRSTMSLTYSRHGSGSGGGVDHDHEALLQHLEEIDAGETFEEIKEPEYDSEGNLIDEGDFIFDSETDSGEWSDGYLASDHASDDEEAFAP